MDYHLPVLLTEACDSLNVKPGKVYIDVTLGHGGHTLEILKRGGQVYSIDQDPQNLDLVTNRIKDTCPELLNNFHPIHGNFSEISSLKIPRNISGLLADLGLNSHQQKASGRGFSFNDSESLDMRLDPKTQINTAENIINTYSYNDLVEIFTKNAQENLAEPIVRQIILTRQQQPIKTATRLTEIISRVYQQKNIHSSHNPATKIFLALRIEVNQEFSALSKLLSYSLSLPKQSNVSIISFHSGEDRIVKLFIKKNSTFIQNSKAIRPTPEEINSNPLSRSAILRSYRII